MPRNNSFSMTGKNAIKQHALSGSFRIKDININDIPIEIKNIKITIMNLIILPFLAKNWKKVIENLCFIDTLSKNIQNAMSRFTDNEHLDLYKNLLIAFEMAIVNYMEIKNLENYFSGSGNETATLVFKTTMMRLRPEYEIYNLILGKPLLKNGQKYDQTIIDYIKSIIDTGEINFEKIKLSVINKLYG